MTWQEWCDSEYNTDGIFYSGDYIYYATAYIVDENYSFIHPDDIIKSDIAYNLMQD